MFTALIYSDLHATDGSEKMFSNPNQYLQHHRVEKFYDYLLGLKIAHKCDAIWDLGDSLNDRSEIPVSTIHCLERCLKKLEPHKTDFSIKCVGNHEQYVRDTSIDSSSLFDRAFNSIRGIKTFVIEGVAVIVCSYPESYTAAAQQLQSELLRYRRMPTVILGHFDVVGTKLKSGKTQITGMPKDILNMASLTVLGHIHQPMVVSDSIYYVGSPFQQNFGEEGEEKRIGKITINGDEVSLEWIPSVGFPEYKTVSLSQFKNLASIDSEDRLVVVLNTPEESEEFYAHPMSARAEIKYSFDTAASQSSESVASTTDWSMDTCIKNWVEYKDPTQFGINMEKSDLVDLGKQLAEFTA